MENGQNAPELHNHACAERLQCRTEELFFSKENAWHPYPMYTNEPQSYVLAKGVPTTPA